MTVSYNSSIATTTFGAFGRLLFRWKASVYKLVWRELLIFISMYVIVAVIYRSALSCPQQKEFEAWASYCKEHAKVIPLTFMVGFFVDYVLNRWWRMFEAIHTPDRACLCVNMAVTSDEPVILQYRRAVARYLNLAQLLVLRDVSTSVKSRFPTMDDVVSNGFLTPDEKLMFDKLSGSTQLEKHHKFWLVVHWATDVLCKIYDKNCFRDAHAFTLAFEEVLSFRDSLEVLLGYDWVGIPLSYIQVVTLAVYAFFMTSAFGDQYLIHEKCLTDNTTESSISFDRDVSVVMMFPIFPVVGFVFVMGWLKVGEAIMNPFGKDDDDFEMNYIINRNLAVSYAIVDSHRSTCPVIKDETEPSLPESSGKAKRYKGSAANYMPPVKKDKG